MNGDALYRAMIAFAVSVTCLDAMTESGQKVFTFPEYEWNALRTAMFTYYTQRQQELLN